jgi:hypothetical protein
MSVEVNVKDRIAKKSAGNGRFFLCLRIDVILVLLSIEQWFVAGYNIPRQR